VLDRDERSGRSWRGARLDEPLPIFVVTIRYRGSLDEVDRLMDEHQAFLDEHYASGRFLASGRRVPRDGGMILACGSDEGEIAALVATDPFAKAGVAEYELTRIELTRLSERVRVEAR
jgi:uncharacterized protein YciI